MNEDVELPALTWTAGTEKRIVAGRFRGMTVRVVALIGRQATVRMPGGMMATYPTTDLAPVVHSQGKGRRDVDPKALA